MNPFTLTSAILGHILSHLDVSCYCFDLEIDKNMIKADVYDED